MDRVDTGRDLWPGVRDRLSQRRRARVPVLVKLVAAAAGVSLIAMLAILRPWSLSHDAMSPFAAVAHAYDGLHEFETVRYRVDGNDSFGQHYVGLHQVDMVNRIHYSAIWSGTDPAGNPPSTESITVGGKAYDRNWMSEGGWAFSRDTRGWAPFGDFGGLPWSRKGAQDRYDRVDLVGDVEIDGGRQFTTVLQDELSRPGRPGMWLWNLTQEAGVKERRDRASWSRRLCGPYTHR